MASEWPTRTLDEVVSLQRGHELSEKVRRPGSVPVLGSFGVTGYHDEAKVRGPGVTIGRAGASFGVASYVAADYWPINTCLFVTDFHGNDPRFVYYLLRELRDELQAHNSGSAQPMLNRNYIKKVEVSLPPITEQREIAGIVGRLDDKLQTNAEMSRTLEAIARTLFRSWFVDFHPVRARMEGRPTGLPDDIAALFPKTLTTTPHGAIPTGWEIVRVPEIVEFNPARPLRKGESGPYVEMASAPTQGHRPTSWPLREHGSGCRFTQGDTLLARITGCLENGKTAFVDFLGPGEVGWGSTEFIVMRPREPIPPLFAYFLARDDDFRAFAIANMNGSSGRQRVPVSAFDNYWFVRPPPAIATAWGELVEPLMTRAKANDEQSRTLATLRDALLPKLLSGEIRVPVGSV